MGTKRFKYTSEDPLGREAECMLRHIQGYMKATGTGEPEMCMVGGDYVIKTFGGFKFGVGRRNGKLTYSWHDGTARYDTPDAMSLMDFFRAMDESHLKNRVLESALNENR